VSFYGWRKYVQSSGGRGVEGGACSRFGIFPVACERGVPWRPPPLPCDGGEGGCSRERHVIFVYIRTRAAPVGLKSRPIDPPPPRSVRLARALVERPMNLRKRIICTHEKRPCTMHIHTYFLVLAHPRDHICVQFTYIRFVSSSSSIFFAAVVSQWPNRSSICSKYYVYLYMT